MSFQRFIANLIINNAMQIGKSILKAYSKAVSGAAATQGGKKSRSSNQNSGGGEANDGFNKMKEQMGMMGGSPMTRNEALMILNIEEETKQTQPNENMEEVVTADAIMDRYETLMEKN